MADDDKRIGHLTIGYAGDSPPEDDEKMCDCFGGIDKDLVYSWWGSDFAGNFDEESNVVIILESSHLSIRDNLEHCCSSRNALERARDGGYAQIVWFADREEKPFCVVKYEGDEEYSMTGQTFQTLKEISDYLINPTKSVAHAPGSVGDLIQEKLKKAMQARLEYIKENKSCEAESAYEAKGLQEFKSASLRNRDINLLLG